MILIDVNLWVYAFNSVDERHVQTKLWLEDILSSEELVLVPWQNILGFVRQITLPHSRTSLQLSKEIFEEFFGLLNLQNVVIVEPSARFANFYKDLVLKTQAYGNLAPDAYLAALATENGATLASNDKGFSRFESEGLKWFNPLTVSSIDRGKRNKKINPT